MTEMPLAHHCESTPPPSLPQTLPIFPLAGVLLLPRGRLPLRIFEPRYVAMVEDCLVGDPMIGMIQPTDPNSREEVPALYAVGCAGRITSYRELTNDRYLITLTGICRFRVRSELKPLHGYRRVTPGWGEFVNDPLDTASPAIGRSRLLDALPCYLEENDIVTNWETILGAPLERLVSSLAMVCPFHPSEKQALLEAPTLAARTELLTSLIEMAVVDARLGGRRACH